MSDIGAQLLYEAIARGNERYRGIYHQLRRLRLTSWFADNPSATQNIKASNSGVKYMIPSSEKLLKFAPVALFLASDQSA
jgi:hypothetical protein